MFYSKSHLVIIHLVRKKRKISSVIAVEKNPFFLLLPKKKNKTKKILNVFLIKLDLRQKSLVVGRFRFTKITHNVKTNQQRVGQMFDLAFVSSWYKRNVKNEQFIVAITKFN